MQAIEQVLPKQALSAVLEYFAGPDLFSRNELLGDDEAVREFFTSPHPLLERRVRRSAKSG